MLRRYSRPLQTPQSVYATEPWRLGRQPGLGGEVRTGVLRCFGDSPALCMQGATGAARNAHCIN